MHIQEVINHPLVTVDKIKASGLKIVVDGVNSIGGIAIPALLKEFDLEVIECIASQMDTFHITQNH